MGSPCPPSPRAPAPLPAYRAQLGPHRGAARCSSAAAETVGPPRPGPAPGRVTSAEGRGRADPGGPAPHAAAGQGRPGSCPRAAGGPRPAAALGSPCERAAGLRPAGRPGVARRPSLGPFCHQKEGRWRPSSTGSGTENPEAARPPWPKVGRGHLARRWASRAFPVLTLLSCVPLQAFEPAVPSQRDTVPSCLRAAPGSLFGCRPNSSSCR